MKLIKAKFELCDEIKPLEIYKKIELIGRICYKSEDRISEDTYENFIKSIIKRGHLSVLEHVNITGKFICDRGVTHELVRRRIASYSQESTRYVGYSNKLLPIDNMNEEDVIDKYTNGISMKKISDLSKGKYK